MSIITERGLWSNSTVDERGRRIFNSGLDEHGRRVFGLTSGTTTTKTFSDSVTVADNNLAKSVLLVKSDSISSSDTFSQAKLIGAKTQSISDSITLSDSFTKSIFKVITETISLNDNYSKTGGTILLWLKPIPPASSWTELNQQTLTWNHSTPLITSWKEG